MLKIEAHKCVLIDETKIELLDNNSASHVWRQKGCVYDPKNTIHTVTYGSESIMNWHRFCAKGTGIITHHQRKYLSPRSALKLS